MSKDDLLSFSVGLDGSVVLRVADGHTLDVIDQRADYIRISASPSFNISPTQGSDRTSAFAQAAKIGDVMPDGSIYVGVSPRNSEPCFIPDTAVPTAMNQTEMVAYLEKLKAHGHQDWCLPYEDDCQEMFECRGNVPLLARVVKAKYYRVKSG